jgi:hypothetical protein
MTDKEHLAAEAQRLLNEPLLVDALNDMMADAFAEFKALRVSPETLPDVIALQQRINVIQEIPEKLKSHIIAAGEMDGGFSGEKPTE